MSLFKKKHTETNEKNLSYVFKCDEILDINEINIGSLFNVSVSTDTNDVIISIAKVYEDHLASAFIIEEHNGSYKTAKLSVTLSGRFESTGKDKAEVILPKSKLNLERIELSGAAEMVGGHINAISTKIITSGAASITATANSQRVEINASGASSVLLDGIVHTLVISANGSSTIYAGELENRNVIVEAHGASGVFVNPSDCATGHASGAARIHYGGAVRYEDIKTSGAASKKPI